MLKEMGTPPLRSNMCTPQLALSTVARNRVTKTQNGDIKTRNSHINTEQSHKDTEQSHKDTEQSHKDTEQSHKHGTVTKTRNRVTKTRNRVTKTRHRVIKTRNRVRKTESEGSAVGEQFCSKTEIPPATRRAQLHLLHGSWSLLFKFSVALRPQRPYSKPGP